MNKNRHYYDRLTMALDDLLRCKRYCEMMLKLPIGKAFSEERTLYESLFVAFIVSYGRLFTTSNTVDPSFKSEVSNEFGSFRIGVINKQEAKLQKLHKRIMDKRNSAIAHSDANSRNYQHYSNSLLATGRNPDFPYEHEEVAWSLELVGILIDSVGNEQSRIGSCAFDNTLFDNQ